LNFMASNFACLAQIFGLAPPTVDTNINDATPNLEVSMADCEHETCAEMCRRTDAWLAAAAVESASRCDFNERVSHDNEGADMEVAAAAQQKNEKKETPTKIWKRILQQKEAKSVKSVKTAAKKVIKQIEIRKMTTHFPRK
jgi:hypothetical protein